MWRLGRGLKLGIIGAVAGLINGFFGSGGGGVAVPTLEKFGGLTAKQAHATSVALILPISAVSAFVYVRGGTTAWLTVLAVSAGGLLGGYVGAKLLRKMSPMWLHKLFGAAMIAAGVKMIWR